MKPCTQWERIAILETKHNALMEIVNRIETKLDDFIEKCDNVYATKNELQSVKDELAMGNARKVAWIQQYGGIISWILGLVGVALAIILK